MHILTLRCNGDASLFLGVFPDFVSAKKEINRHVKITRALVNKKSKTKFEHRTNIYLIHNTNSNTAITLNECEGSCTEFAFNTKTNKLFKVRKYEIMHSFAAFCSPKDMIEKEKQLDKIVKVCNGEITGGGCGLGLYDFSILIPIENVLEFKKLMKDAKFRCKDYGKVSPYID